MNIWMKSDMSMSFQRERATITGISGTVRIKSIGLASALRRLSRNWALKRWRGKEEDIKNGCLYCDRGYDLDDRCLCNE